MKRPRLQCLLLAGVGAGFGAACAGGPDRGASSGAASSIDDLRPGLWVEAKGPVLPGHYHVTQIDEVPRGADDKADKVELTAPVERASEHDVRMLGHGFTVDAASEFEHADKQALPPFVPAIGDWLRLKARAKDGEPMPARTLRAIPARDQFKVTGEVRAIDVAGSTIDVSGVVLPVAQEVDLGLTRGRDPGDPLSLFLADDQKAVPFSVRLGDAVRLGGQAAAEVEWNDEFDLDAARARDRTKPSYGGKLDVLWLLDGRGSYALGEVAFSRADTIRQNDVDTYEEQLEVTRAFASLRVLDDLQVLVGRQDFDEGREWLYDEVLDGARAVWRTGDFHCELGAAVGRSFAAEPNADEDTGVLIAKAGYRVDSEWHVGAYVLQRTDDTGRGFEPMLFGVQSLAERRYGLGHWLELGGARGDDGSRAIKGHAFDAGVLWTFDTAWRPSLGAGFAFASGEADGSTRSGYRQSGLQDNNGKLGGVTSVRYYGELLDPELSNLSVTTLVAAVRPLPGFSVSLLAHSYRQDTASMQLRETSSLRADPSGDSRDLGHEFDVVLGYRLERRLTVELVAGRFEPGDAFPDSPAANLLTLTTRFSF